MRPGRNFKRSKDTRKVTLFDRFALALLSATITFPIVAFLGFLWQPGRYGAYISVWEYVPFVWAFRITAVVALITFIAGSSFIVNWATLLIALLFEDVEKRKR